MEFNLLIKNIIFNNPVHIHSYWQCLCEIFSNNSGNYIIGKDSIIVNYPIIENPKINREYISYLNKKLENDKLNSSIILDIKYKEFMFNFIENNIDDIINTSISSFSIRESIISDFNLSRDSNIWKVNSNSSKFIKDKALEFAEHAKHLLWSTYSIIGTKETPESFSAWLYPEYVPSYLKLTHKISEIKRST